MASRHFVVTGHGGLCPPPPRLLLPHHGRDMNSLGLFTLSAIAVWRLWAVSCVLSKQVVMPDVRGYVVREFVVSQCFKIIYFGRFHGADCVEVGM